MSFYPEYNIEEHYPADKTIRFSKCTEEWGILSNFFYTPIVVDGTKYASVEQLYHSIRLNNAEERTKFLTLPPNLGIKMRAKAFKRLGFERNNWRAIAVDVMRFCVLQKYIQNDSFRSVLDQTKGKYIVEDQSLRHRNPDVWGAVFDPINNEYYGKNIMGRILMELREMKQLPYTPFEIFIEENNLCYPRIVQACKYIGVDMTDFNLCNEMFSRPYHKPIHGIGHLYRTMIGCALIGEQLQKPRAGFLAFCGAYIHDLARNSDGKEPEHGANAVKYKFHKFERLWQKYSLNVQERQWICEAVKQHSTREWMQRNDAGYDVMAILKDADALDRCRIKDLNPKMLRYPSSKQLIKVIENCCNKTRFHNSNIDFNAFCKLL